MTAMVERVARAIAVCPTAYDVNTRVWETEVQAFREECLALARAALEALRDPTDGMIAAATRASAAAGHVYAEYCPLIWRAMIDAALAD